MIRINDIIQVIQNFHKRADLTPVHKAYIIAAQAHRGVVRKSGEPYISHPLAVAHILASMSLDPYTVAAGLLHDTIEDTDVSFEDLRDEFGSDIAFLVDGVTKIEAAVGKSNKSDLKAGNLRKMIVAMAKDIRVLLIKLADRLHNMRTLEHMKPEKQQMIASETLEMYAPLAHRLGINWIKNELEDLCLRYLDPEAYTFICDQLEMEDGDRERYIQDLIATIRTQMDTLGIDCEVTGRPKHFNSIYRKIKKQNVSPRELFDLFALRIIIESEDSTPCYIVLGELHRCWKAVPNRLKDYITNPKSNMYQSLHTTVIGPGGYKVEFQIRTRRMHRIAEDGIAAHWAYKEGANSAEQSETDRFQWLRNLLDSGEEYADSGEFLNALRRDLYIREVYVFSPRGDTFELPEDACVLDFAYAIHSEVGDRCQGAYINGKYVNIRHKLENGDTIEIVTSEKQHPKQEWLQFVRTNKARHRINSYINRHERERAIAKGREILDKALKAQSTSIKHLNNEQVDRLLDIARRGSLDDTFRDIGQERIQVDQLINKLFHLDNDEQQREIEIQEAQKDQRILRKQREKQRSNGSGIRVKGLSDLLIHIAQCCSPVPGDMIVGFITHGRGVSIHKADCSMLVDAPQERMVDAEWDCPEDRKDSYSIHLSVEVEDRKGALADLSKVISDNHVNINNLQIHRKEQGPPVVARLDFTLEIANRDQFTKLKNRIRSLPFVLELN